jgi:hypothetical protein
LRNSLLQMGPYVYQAFMLRGSILALYFSRYIYEHLSYKAKDFRVRFRLLLVLTVAGSVTKKIWQWYGRRYLEDGTRGQIHNVVSVRYVPHACGVKCKLIFSHLLIIKSNRCTNFSNLFCNKTLYVSDSSSVHHQELFTVQSSMVYVIQVCRQLSSRISMELQFHPVPDRKLSTNLYDIYHSCMYSGKLLIMDRGTVRNM